MATTDTTQNAEGGHAPSARVELRTIALSRIIVPDGFNPRGEVADDGELEAMAETMRQRGCLQSIRVRATETGEYVLVAGERRYRAAVKAALVELPAIVSPIGAGDEAEYLDLLCDAMIENEVRSDLNPLQRAQGYQAMIDCGLSVRGVAEKLGGKAKRSSREKRIKDHLPILLLPESVRKRVAAEEVPLLAVKALVALAEIHEDLPGFAVAGVLDVDPDYNEPHTWTEVAEHSLTVALAHCEELPAGLFLSSHSYPVDTFELSEKATKDLAAYNKLTGGNISAVRFSIEQIEQARVLGAAHNCGWSHLIVGVDVATTLAEDYIAHVLKQARAQVRRQREIEKERQDATGGQDGADNGGDGESQTLGEMGQSPEEKAKAQREAEYKKREKAIRFNLDLGVLAFKHLSRVKVDERVLRILASVDLARSLREIASRGARISFPGWVTQTEQRNGKTKTTYMETTDAETRARTFLAGAESAGDIAGRTLTLIALASLVNEQDAVPQSRRSYHELTFRGPFAAQAEHDLDVIVRERIKAGQLPALDAILNKRIGKAEKQAQHEAEIASATVRLESASARLPELDEEELEKALSDAELAWGKHSSETRELRSRVGAVREQRASAKTGEQEHTGEPATTAAAAA